jgi:hypothetical protein
MKTREIKRSEKLRSVAWQNFIDVSEESTTSIFRVGGLEEQANRKETACYLLGLLFDYADNASL